MKKDVLWMSMLPIYGVIFTLCLVITLLGNRVATVMSEASPLPDRVCIIIDAGHGGVDGGATACTGILESNLNLQYALRLEDMLHLLGYPTKMIRRTDASIYIQGDTIAAKKVSDLKERVRIVNETDNAILISIHQNYFPDDRYYGAQVFYANTSGSKDLAASMQSAIASYADTANRRKIKSAHGIYLIDHIECTGILIECGFISNPAEAAKLSTPDHQKRLCAIISATLANYLES